MASIVGVRPAPAVMAAMAAMGAPVASSSCSSSSSGGGASAPVAALGLRRSGFGVAPAGLSVSGAMETSWRKRARSESALRSGVALVPVRAVAMPDSLTDEDSEERAGEMGLGQRELKDYPPGLQRYETMAVLRPDISEEQRLALTQRYEEAIIAGGGLDVEMFNRGMQPLAYNINTRNMQGVSSRYLDGIYLLFTYVTKPESQLGLQKKLNADDDIIRSTTFRLKV